MHKSPGYAVLMLIFLLSLAGIPPTAGFLGKYYIFLSLIETGHYALAVIATLYVAVAIYYYFRIVRSMFIREADGEGAGARRSFGLRLALAVSGVLTLGDRHLSRAVPAAGADVVVPVRTHMETVLNHPLFMPILVTLVIIAVFPLVAGYIVLVERKVLADFQVRLGPMRVGPHGLLQPHRRRAEAAAQGRHHSRPTRTRRSSGSRR